MNKIRSDDGMNDPGLDYLELELFSEFRGVLHFVDEKETQEYIDAHREKTLIKKLGGCWSKTNRSESGLEKFLGETGQWIPARPRSP